MNGQTSPPPLTSSTQLDSATVAPTTEGAAQRCPQCHGALPSSLGESTHHHHVGDKQTCFYFVVFLSNSSPIFHSNRIPVDLLPASVPAGTACGAEVDARHAVCPSCCPTCKAFWVRLLAPSSSAWSPSSGDALSPEDATHAVVGDHARRKTLAEAPQQTLQAVAFPSAFGGGGLRPPPALATPVKKPKQMRRPPVAVTRSLTRVDKEANEADARSVEDDAEDSPLSSSTPVTDLQPMDSTRNAESGGGDEAASAKGTSLAAASSASVAPLPEGPPWNLRLEEVRSANGCLRFHRIILTAAFTVVVSSHTGGMHSMQTRQSAVALVLTCPPAGEHYRLLLNHFDVCRGLLHRALAFGMRTTQKFFLQLFAAQVREVEGGGPARITQQTQQRIMRKITSLLEKDDAALSTYEALKHELTVALTPRQPLPHLWLTQPARSDSCSSSSNHSGAPMVPFHLSVRGFVPPASLTQPAPLWGTSALLCTALADLMAYGEDFLTSCIAGLLDVGGTGPSDAVGEWCGSSEASQTDKDPAADFWSSLASQAATDGVGLTRCRTACQAQKAQDTAAGGGMLGVSVRRRPVMTGANAAATAASSVAAAATAAAGASREGAVATATRLRRPPRGLVGQPLAGAKESGASAGSPSASAQSPHSQGPSAPPTAAATATAAAAKDGYSLSFSRKARVIIFGSDPVLAQRLMVIACFFLKSATPSTARRSSGAASAHDWMAQARCCYEECFAARVDASGAATATVPVQWVPEEFSEQQQEKLVSAVYSPENALLILAPRLLLCRRLQLHKTMETSTLFIEQQQTPGGDAAALHRQTQVAKLFRCRLKSQRSVPPDAIVGTLVREAVALEQGSRGVVSCATVLADMMAWLACQDRTRALQSNLYGYDVLSEECSPSASASVSGSGVGVWERAGSGLFSRHHGGPGVLSYVKRPSLMASGPSSPLGGGHANAPGASAAPFGSTGFPSSAPVGVHAVNGASGSVRHCSRGGSVASSTARSPSVQDVLLPGSSRLHCVDGGDDASAPLRPAAATAAASGSADDALSRLFDSRGIVVPPDLLSTPMNSLSRYGSVYTPTEERSAAAASQQPPRHRHEVSKAASSPLARFFSSRFR